MSSASFKASSASSNLSCSGLESLVVGVAALPSVLSAAILSTCFFKSPNLFMFTVPSLIPLAIEAANATKSSGPLKSKL